MLHGFSRAKHLFRKLAYRLGFTYWLSLGIGFGVTITPYILNAF